MNQEERIRQIKSKLSAFTSKTYTRDEVVDEYQNLMNQMVSLTFNDAHAENGCLGIKDVMSHLEDLNMSRGNIADIYLNDFKYEIKGMNNDLNKLISGYKGEAKAFSELEKLASFNKVLTNVELTNEGERTEIDAVVFTTKQIFIVEVKNTSQDVEITESGNYYRLGKYKNFDSPILEKQITKEHLLRDILNKKGIRDVQISKIVVFTNPKIFIVNECEQLKTICLQELIGTIDGFEGEDIYSDEDIKELLFAVQSSRVYETYPLKCNINKVKNDFAMLMIMLEEAEDVENNIEQIQASSETVEINDLKNTNSWFDWKSAGIGWSIGVVTTVACTVIFKNAKVLKAI